MVRGGLPPAQIGPFVKDINFPANKKDVIQHAQDINADEEVIDTLKSLPNQQFNSSQELKRVLADIQRQF